MCDTTVPSSGHFSHSSILERERGRETEAEREESHHSITSPSMELPLVPFMVLPCDGRAGMQGLECGKACVLLGELCPDR